MKRLPMRAFNGDQSHFPLVGYLFQVRMGSRSDPVRDPVLVTLRVKIPHRH